MNTFILALFLINHSCFSFLSNPKITLYQPKKTSISDFVSQKSPLFFRNTPRPNSKNFFLDINKDFEAIQHISQMKSTNMKNPFFNKSPYPVAEEVHGSHRNSRTRPTNVLAYGRYALDLMGIPHKKNINETELIQLLKNHSRLNSFKKNRPSHAASPPAFTRLDMVQDLAKIRTKYHMDDSSPSLEIRTIELLENIKTSDSKNLRNYCLDLALPIFTDFSTAQNSLSLLNIKAWLNICSHILNETPTSLEKLKNNIGDYRNSKEWSSELYLTSMAKHHMRRIYRHRESDTVISETLDDQGAVFETEMITKRKNNGSLNFASYNEAGALKPYGIFRNHRGDYQIKFTPDSCLGCHFHFETREFNIIRPSFSALNLRTSEFLSPEIIDERKKQILPGENVTINDFS